MRYFIRKNAGYYLLRQALRRGINHHCSIKSILRGLEDQERIARYEANGGTWQESNFGISRNIFMWRNK